MKEKKKNRKRKTNRINEYKIDDFLDLIFHFPNIKFDEWKAIETFASYMPLEAFICCMYVHICWCYVLYIQHGKKEMKKN